MGSFRHIRYSGSGHCGSGLLAVIVVFVAVMIVAVLIMAVIVMAVRRVIVVAGTTLFVGHSSVLALHMGRAR
jgi:hypothetical protein